ncbi:aminoacylase-1-like [Dysidea avara]|uniref:aminoacylase-1-like n=1 Tax=Dysidea avara TaxID=196820 RepID=UPI00332358AD
MSDPKRPCLEEDVAITTFRRYLRINTSHPNPDYASAVTFLKEMAREIGLGCDVVELSSGLPVVVMSWMGSDPSLQAILFNSHMDVVPVFPDHWTHPPFDAVKTDNGDIIARGTQDMKSCGIWYIEAIRRLKSEGKSFKRNIFITFVPDEELGGSNGMKLFVQLEYFKKLNVGFALDEGVANPTENFWVFSGERTVWWVEVTCTGNTGHGSAFIKDTAMEKLYKIMTSALEFRKSEEKRLEADPSLTLGDVTTININQIQGGVQPNVIPSEMKIIMDIRVSPHRDIIAFKELLNSWVTEAGEGCSYRFVQYNDVIGLSPTDDGNLWWRTFSSTLTAMGEKFIVSVFQGGTDIRFLRMLGIPSLGFSPMNHTPKLLHDHDEFLNEKIFLRGVEIYCELIPALASC